MVNLISQLMHPGAKSGISGNAKIHHLLPFLDLGVHKFLGSLTELVELPPDS